jgi:hypothetical protein
MLRAALVFAIALSLGFGAALATDIATQRAGVYNSAFRTHS